MNKPVRVGITHGDINGVGYEVILKALADERIVELCTPVIFGSHGLVAKCRKDLGIEDFSFRQVATPEEIIDSEINLIDIPLGGAQLTPGVTSPLAGKIAVAALEAACQALIEGYIDVLVTAPLCKESVNSDEFNFPGHTEYLQHRIGGGAKSLMILCNDTLRVALVTTHLPIARVPEAITVESVSATVRALDKSLKDDFSIYRPTIAVLSLNPHCGDGGLLGDEEKTKIAPAIERCVEEGILAFGPFAADGFFSAGAFKKYDGIVAMYHDQGLAPFKTLAGESGVNFTAGLPYVRTSPDHGTAFDIAWKGVADPQSMREAIYKAIDIFHNRVHNAEAARNPLFRNVVERPDKKGGDGAEKPNRHDKPYKKGGQAASPAEIAGTGEAGETPASEENAPSKD